LTKEGISTTPGATKAERRTMAEGTARKPAFSKSTAPQPSNFEATLSHHTASPGPPLMISIGLSLNESSTAFFSHWFTCQAPSSCRWATRAAPLSRRSSAVSTASRTSPRVAVETDSRSSNALSMIFSRFARSDFGISAPLPDC